MNEIQRARRRIIASLPKGLTYAQVLAAISYTGTTSASEVTYASGKKYAVIKFLTSGTLTLSREFLADIFCVGGGTGGSIYAILDHNPGGSGCTATTSGATINQAITVTIGAGGIGKKETLYGANGGATSFGAILSANGGNQMNGGSGAAGTDGQPGTNGSDGTGTDKGTGQHTTTRAFAEPDGELFATGGRCDMSRASGTPNTGNGGNCGGYTEDPKGGYVFLVGGNGGSGIAMMRVEIA